MRIILMALLLSIAGAVSAQDLTNKPASKEVNEEWVVVLADPRPARLQGWVRPSYGKSSGDYQGSLELARFGKKVVSKYDMQLHDEWFIESLGVYCLVVSFKNDQEKNMSRLKKDKMVQWIQPSNEFELFNSKEKVNETEIEKTDENSASRLPNSIDGKGVVIAIIDSAVDEKHQDLVGSINKSGDFVIAGRDNSVGEAHGTAIAGVMISQRDTKLGVAGISPAAKIESYRACWESIERKTQCNTLSLARALDAVVRSEAHILNLSLSGPEDALLDQILGRVIDNGKMVVAAFDPERPNGARFPSSRDGVLIVRAQGLDEMYNEVFVAPGARVVATPGNNYDFMHGHSVATAYTSGLLALRKQASEADANDALSKDDWRDTSKSKLAADIVRELLQESS